MGDLASIGQTLSVWFLPVVIAITLHEAAHAWMADKLGDGTARSLGRVSFNPIRHIDPVGTLVLPGLLLLLNAPFLFGYAKPVPVAFHRLNNPKRDMIWVALAGPGINILLALIVSLAMHLLASPETPVLEWIWYNLDNALIINVVLACFNMIPLLPLDGGRVLAGLLPLPLAARYAATEKFGFPILLLLLFAVPYITGMFGLPFSPIAEILLPMIRFVHGLITTLTGW